ncbi:MAG: IclR family transcriptional regulator [Magnetovibrio sp.]|nr:IclR family transcriptional regulator [Magnetovibrio sp.]
MRDKGHSFLRVFSIMEAVVASPWPVSYSELAERLDLAKPTAHRLCDLLESQKLIERAVDGRRYIPGPRLRSLSMEVLGGSTLLLERQLVLQSISAKVGETCNLTVPNGTEMLYLDRVETDWPLRISLPVGSRVPLHCTASGKLYLSQLAARERKRLIDTLMLEPFTSNTITDPEVLMAELKKTRSEGIGVDDEEFYEGMVAVSVPINDPRGRICATLAVHGPIQRLTLEKAMTHVPAMKAAAERLEATLSADPRQ